MAILQSYLYQNEQASKISKTMHWYLLEKEYNGRLEFELDLTISPKVHTYILTCVCVCIYACMYVCMYTVFSSSNLNIVRLSAIRISPQSICQLFEFHHGRFVSSLNLIMIILSSLRISSWSICHLFDSDHGQFVNSTISPSLIYQLFESPHGRFVIISNYPIYAFVRKATS